MNTLPDEKASIDDSHDAAWVQKCVEDFVFLSPENTLGFDHEEKVFDKPLVGFASGSDPLWQEYQSHIGEFYLTPSAIFQATFPEAMVTARLSPELPPALVADQAFSMRRSLHPANLKPGTLNLASLLAGSEGTLAIIRRAKVKLVEKPEHTILTVLTYQSNADACDDVPRLLAHRPSAVELIPRFIIRQARSIPSYARQMGWVLGDPAALLVVEFSGDRPSELQEAALAIGDVLTIAESKEDQARIWNVRKVGLGLLDSRPQSLRPAAFIEDCAIPVDHLGEFVREVERILSAHGTEGGIYAHASAGCLHIRPILDLKTARGVSDLRAISEAVFALTLRLGGAMSSEHGDGLARSEFLEQTLAAERD